MCAMLTIHIDASTDAAGSATGLLAIADVLPIAAMAGSGGPAGGTAGSNADSHPGSASSIDLSSGFAGVKIRPITGVVVGINESSHGTQVDVPAGEWLVRARLPSGEVLSQAVSLREGEPATARLIGQVAPAQDLEEVFGAGAVPSAKAYAKRLAAVVKLARPLRELVSVAPGAGGTSWANEVDDVDEVNEIDSVDEINEIHAVEQGNFVDGMNAGEQVSSVDRHAGGASGERYAAKPASGVRSTARRPAYGRNPSSGFRFGPTTTSRAQDDRRVIRERPRAAIDVFEAALRRQKAAPVVEPGVSMVLATLDIDATLNALATDAPIRQLAARLFGECTAVRPATLTGTTLIKTANVDLPSQFGALASVRRHADHPVRAFGWLRKDGPDGYAVIACLPHAWEVDPSDTPAKIRAVASGVGPEKTARPGLRIVVDDPGMNSILGFLQSGDLDSAERLTRLSLEYLYEKDLNPYAAAAGAYALVHVPGAADASEPWPRWIRHLSNRFPDIPDGPILLATLLLQRGAGELAVGRPGSSAEHDRAGFEECRRLLLRAVCSGPPIFRLGLRLLAENLEIVRGLEREYGLATGELDRAAELVRWMSLRVDTSQPFTALKV